MTLLIEKMSFWVCLNTRRGSKRDVVQLSDFKSDFKSEDDNANDSDPNLEVKFLNDPTLRNESTLEICSSCEDNSHNSWKMVSFDLVVTVKYP